ncbi:prohead protease/major capsid protein fusion protein [Aquamicrobium ahrensii]|uniref:Uncharacterized protein n=1 Tax=Aquamicrobium ahrensii TaxID=469551 RepID=A0ABV2KFY4_9HYPH
MTARTQGRSVQDVQTRSAAVTAGTGSLNAEARTIKVVWTTGAAVKRYSWDEGYYMEELAVDRKSIRLDRFEAMSLLDGHEQSMDARLGTVVPGSVKFESGKATATLRLSRNAKAESILRDLEDGHPINISVGYKIHRYEKTEGGADTLPTIRAIDWEPMELSVVAVPADPGAVSRKEQDMPEDNTPPEQQRQQHQRPANLIAERRRVKDIRDLARSMNMAEDEMDAAIDSGEPVESFRARAFDKMIERQNQSPTFPHVETRGMQDSQETLRRMVANAILHRSGLVDKLEDGAREWRGMPTMDIVKEVMRFRGESTRGSVHDVASRAMHSSSDFPIILQDITNQVVLSAYSAYENTFQLIASRKVLSDYRETKVIDIGSAPDLLLKNEHGEFKAGTIRESEEGMKLQRYGRSIGFTHEMLVNDRLDAFMDVVRNWGLKVAKLEGDIVWGAVIGDSLVLKDGKPLFHADHNNLTTPGTALDESALVAARKAFRQQKDIDRRPINIAPKYLFVGTDLEIVAQKLITGNLVATKTDDVVPQAIKSLVPVYEPRLDDIPGGKAWFLFADINQAMGRGIHYLHLLGHETPTTAEQIGFRIEGVEFTIAHSFGVGITDYRYAYKNAGDTSGPEE